MRGSRIKRQPINNFLDNKLVPRGDFVIEEELKGKKESDDLEQTIILAKKGDTQDDVKKYVEATRKSNVISRPENFHPLRNTEQERQSCNQP